MDIIALQKLVNSLKDHISPARFARITAIAGQRTRYLAVVLENIYYTQNISAVVRTCECLGIQDVYITGKTPSARINKHVAIGAGNWVTVHRKNRLPGKDVLQQLKAARYRLVAAVAGEKTAVPFYDFDLQQGKTVIILGNEAQGISRAAREEADELITIPMYGFSDSFNISVSAAIILAELAGKLRRSGIQWRLSEQDILQLQYGWIKATLKQGDDVSREYMQRLDHPNDQFPC